MRRKRSLLRLELPAGAVLLPAAIAFRLWATSSPVSTELPALGKPGASVAEATFLDAAGHAVSLTSVLSSAKATAVVVGDSAASEEAKECLEILATSTSALPIVVVEQPGGTGPQAAEAARAEPGRARGYKVLLDRQGALRKSLGDRPGTVVALLARNRRIIYVGSGPHAAKSAALTWRVFGKAAQKASSSREGLPAGCIPGGACCPGRSAASVTQARLSLSPEKKKRQRITSYVPEI